MIPRPFRDQLPQVEWKFVLVRGFDRCLRLYPEKKWEGLKARLTTLDPFDPEAVKFTRLFLYGCETADLDGQGRLKLSRLHLELADLKGQATILGMLDYLEIWNPDSLKNYLESAEDTKALARNVMGTPKPGAHA